MFLGTLLTLNHRISFLNAVLRFRSKVCQSLLCLDIGFFMHFGGIVPLSVLGRISFELKYKDGLHAF